nr:MAG TPA: hypothetical protein [Caudoviricetes sp.]
MITVGRFRSQQPAGMCLLTEKKLVGLGILMLLIVAKTIQFIMA